MQEHENKGSIFVRLQMDSPFVVPENHPGRKRRVALLRMTILVRMVRRVRKRMKTKDRFFGERAGINTKVAEITENTEEAHCRGDPPRRAGGIGRGRWRGIMREDSTEKLLCQTIT